MAETKIPGIPKYISAEQYAKQSGLGVEEVKRQCRLKEIPCRMTEKGHYKIPIYDDAVPIEEYNKIKQRCTELETTIKSISKLANIS